MNDDAPRLPPRRQARPWIHRALVFATCVLMLDALFGEHGMAERMRARQAIEQTEAGLARVRHENGRLREQIRRLKDDPETIEAAARMDLGLIKPGEVLVVIKDLK